MKYGAISLDRSVTPRRARARYVCVLDRQNVDGDGHGHGHEGVLQLQIPADVTPLAHEHAKTASNRMGVGPTTVCTDRNTGSLPVHEKTTDKFGTKLGSNRRRRTKRVLQT